MQESAITFQFAPRFEEYTRSGRPRALIEKGQQRERIFAEEVGDRTAQRRLSWDGKERGKVRAGVGYPSNDEIKRK
jgi:hypothetical protein